MERPYNERIWLQILKTLKGKIMKSGSYSGVRRGV
jgi:hypothetical protein